MLMYRFTQKVKVVKYTPSVNWGKDHTIVIDPPRLRIWQCKQAYIDQLSSNW